MRHVALFPVCLAVLIAAGSCAEGPPAWEGTWRAWLDSPGGELPFGLDLQRDAEGVRAWIVNGPERIEVPEVALREGELSLRMPHYDSAIRASFATGEPRLYGEWTKKVRGEDWATLPFHATRGEDPRFDPLGDGPARGDDIAGRWSVKFEKDSHPAVGVFEAGEGKTVTGTFLTPTGDYRYLAGSFDKGRLRLSCFDGAHAFLFDATLDGDGTLRGDFWSRDSWHDSWTARRDPEAELPDAFGLTTEVAPPDLRSLVFSDLDGKPRSLAETFVPGDALVLVIFGSWCPNCFDATRLLVELDREYRERGLSIVGLAYELTGDAERDAEQVRAYARHHGIEYPLLLGGVADRQEVSRELPFLDRFRAYPTTVFLDGEGRVKAIHTGFSGPATGPAHDRLRERYREIIEGLLIG